MSDWQVLGRSLTVSILAPFELFKMRIFRLFMILGANFVVTIVAYYRKCYESYSLCLITNIKDIENQYSPSNNCRLTRSPAADWCNGKSSSLAVITKLTVHFAVAEFINDSSARFESDVITNGYRSYLSSWEWINGNIYSNGYLGNDYRYAYLNVAEYGTDVSFYGHATSKRKFICAYNLNSNYGCADGFQKLNVTCYKIREEEVSWYDARNRCLKEEASELAIFDSGLPPLTSERGLTKQYWIGLRKESWNWRNAYAAVKYFNWDDGSPSSVGGNCLCLRVPSGKWTECNCNRKLRFICIQAYSSNSSSSTKTSTTVRTTRPSIKPITLPTTTRKLPATTTTASTTPSTTTITTPTVGDSSSQFHSTQPPGDDLSYKASGKPAILSESGQSSGLILALGIGSASLLILIGFIVVIVVIKNRRSRSGGVGPRQQDFPPQNIDQADAPHNVYAMVVPNTNESARSPSERTRSEIVYAELDLAPTEKRTQRASTPGKTPNQIFHHPAPKGSKRGRSAASESEYANSIPLESVYDNISPS